MIARVIAERERGFFAVGLAGLAMLLVSIAWLDDRVGLGFPIGPGLLAYVMVAASFAIAAIAPWLVSSTRGFTTLVAIAPGRVEAGSISVDAKDVTSVHVASGARGHSIAIARGKRLVFLEVEREGDAARIIDALGVAPGVVAMRSASRALGILQGIVSLALLVSAPLYFAGALRWIDETAKGTFGEASIALTLFTFVLAATRLALPGHALAVRRGAWDAHVALHAKDAAPLRVETHDVALSRGDESLAAWIERLDALPQEHGAYRGDAMKKDVLWDTLNDVAAPVDARMAAARLLRRRHGEEGPSLVRVIDEPDVRMRIEAALEEHDEAARRLEELGPLFRAR